MTTEAQTEVVMGGPELPDPVQQPASVVTPKRPRIRGFACPSCVGVRLFVYRTRRPCAGKVLRYRMCSSCGHRQTTEEKFGHVLPAPKTREQIEQARLEREGQRLLAIAQRKKAREKARDERREQARLVREQILRDRREEREALRALVKERRHEERDAARQRGKRVREMKARGLNLPEIARVLNVQLRTVRGDLSAIGRKLKAIAAATSSPSPAA
jgi:hypothetical protein